MAQERLKGETYSDKLYIEATTPEVRIRYRMEFHVKNLYVMLHDWFVHEGWVERNKDADWPETFFLLRENPTRGNEMWFWWRFEKAPASPEASGNASESSYYRFHMDVFWHLMGIKDIEVMKGGNKFKTQNADLELVFRGRVECDYGRKWRDNPILKPFHEMFFKRMFKTQIEKRRDEIYRECYKVQEVTKTYLGMKRYMSTTEGHEFWPTLGSGDKEGLVPPQ